MSVNQTCPPTVQVKAIDVKPMRYAQWCTVRGENGLPGPPFANTIESRDWSEDGKQIVFMLGTHNFLFADPDQELELIPCPHSEYVDLPAEDDRDARRMTDRPVVTPPCPTCGHQEKPKRKNSGPW